MPCQFIHLKTRPNLSIQHFEDYDDSAVHVHFQGHCRFELHGVRPERIRRSMI